MYTRLIINKSWFMMISLTKVQSGVFAYYGKRESPFCAIQECMCTSANPIHDCIRTSAVSGMDGVEWREEEEQTDSHCSGGIRACSRLGTMASTSHSLPCELSHAFGRSSWRWRSTRFSRTNSLTLPTRMALSLQLRNDSLGSRIACAPHTQTLIDT